MIRTPRLSVGQAQARAITFNGKTVEIAYEALARTAAVGNSRFRSVFMVR